MPFFKFENRKGNQKPLKQRLMSISSKHIRVDFQVFFLTAIIVILSCSAIFLLNYHLSYHSTIVGLQERARYIHSFLDDRLGTDTYRVLRQRQDASLPLYYEYKNVLEETRRITGVRYLYTACQNQDGDFIYLIDGLPADSPDFRYVGDLIEPECIPEMKRALSGETVLPHNIADTSWGAVFISYFPMHDGNEIVGVLGIEFDAKRQYNTYRMMSIATPVIILLSCLIAAGIAVLFFRRISNPAYQDMANTDFLTGGKNRNAFEVDLHNWDLSSARKKISFISVDLDGLKTVNDSYGHEAGDQYIKASCAIMTQSIGNCGVLYRIGGDEFVVIFQNQSEQELENIMAEMNRLAILASGQSKFPISLSTGCAVFDPAEDTSLSNTLKRSDTRMYEQKKRRYAEKARSQH